MKTNILILLDWRGYLCGKFIGTRDNHSAGFLDVKKLMHLIGDEYNIECHKFEDLDLNRNYKDWFVVYASSEERGLLYKRYIEDILLRLQTDGAILIPKFNYFRAHGNKAFQEMLRKQFNDKDLRIPESQIIGRLEEFDADKFTNYPYVVKASSGAGSCGVKLVHNRNELISTVRKLSAVTYYDEYFSRLRDFWNSKIVWFLKDIYRKLRGIAKCKRPKMKLFTNKVIIQDYIPNLEGDYKVLYYFGKYYVLKRLNRDNDFRASGSGKFSFPDNAEEIGDILEYARKVANELDTPMISMDIAQNKNGCYLIEFQFVCFGPYTIQYSEWYFEYNESGWTKIMGESDMETEVARSLTNWMQYLKCE